MNSDDPVTWWQRFRLWLCSLGVHWPRVVRQTRVYLYAECDWCGHRRAMTLPGSGYQPLDRQWVNGGAWSADTMKPPPGGTGARKPKTPVH